MSLEKADAEYFQIATNNVGRGDISHLQTNNRIDGTAFCGDKLDSTYGILKSITEEDITNIVNCSACINRRNQGLMRTANG